MTANSTLPVPETRTDFAQSFEDLKLLPALLRSIQDQGYSTPTPIQLKAIPAVLAGSDLLAAAQTGSGKTAGFALPLLQRIMQSSSGRNRAGQIRALVLTPTRELAAQVEASIAASARHLPLKSTVIFGGVGASPQIARLRRGVDVLVATPGRLLDLFGQGAVDFSSLDILVLDEADRMLDMGFIHDIRRILKLLPPKRQNLMFSATFSPEIRKLAGSFLTNPVSVDVSPKNTAAETIEQQVFHVDQKRKAEFLSRLIRDNDWKQVLIFTRTKHGANRLARRLEDDGIATAAIHGNKSQNARTKALADFKKGAIVALVATDIAARGLDIEQLPHVVNFELPNVPEDYVHRIGRTGRAGLSGRAVSLVSADEEDLMRAIERVLRRNVPGEVVAGFEPGETRSSGNSAAQRNGRTNRNTRADFSRGQGSSRAPARRNNSRAGNGRPSSNGSERQLGSRRAQSGRQNSGR
ncbi:MAG: DEAD/DEAH box helicase [Leptospiraceae bacterium]|nr:DEAD/DEAH box helicase [Leptospiraceae bacterium]MCP5486008.1 DEAD/DEAH box helicase [Spirochaetales bacterium]